MPRPYRDLEPDQFPVLTPAGAAETRFDEGQHPRDKNGMFTSGGGVTIGSHESGYVADEDGPSAVEASLTKEAAGLRDYLNPLIKGGKGQLDSLAVEPEYEDVRGDIVATRDYVRDAGKSLDKALAADDIHDASDYAYAAADHLMAADAAFLAVVDSHPDDDYVRDIGNYMGTGLDDLQALSDKYVAERDNQDAGLEDTESAFAGGPYSSHKNY